MKTKKPKLKSIFKIIFNVLTYAFFVLCIFALIVSVGAKKDSDGAVSLFGMQLRIVVSDSMEKCEQTDVSEYKIKDIPVKSLILISTVPEDAAKAEQWYSRLSKGDVLTFKYVYVKQETITHRITDIFPKDDGGYEIQLEGDNKVSDGNTLTQTIDTSDTNGTNYVVGKVVAKSFLLGLLITALKNPVGLVCIVIIPCFIIMLFEIFKLVNALGEKKRREEQEKNKQRDEELEEMRRKLEQLQQGREEDNTGDEK